MVIKSIDDLTQGDVVNLGIQGPYVVAAIGDVPEHPKEVCVRRLYPSGQANQKIIGEIIFRQADLERLGVEKKDRAEYRGWEYLSVKRLE